MPYVLGVDVGSSRIAAVLCRRTGGSWAEAETVRLGATSSTCTETLYLDESGFLRLGPDAEEPAAARPERAVRGIMRRVGDPYPVVLGSELWEAEDLAAGAISSIVERAGAQEGEPPERVAVTHPPYWGEHRRDVLVRALHRQDLRQVVLVPEPAALAESHAALESVADDTRLATCSLGAARCTAGVLRSNAGAGFELFGDVCTTADIGGDRFDDLLVDHVVAQGIGTVDDLDPDTPAHRAAGRRLRAECERAKIELSERSEVTVTVALAGRSATVQLVRAELDRLVEPVVEAAADTLLRALRQAPQPPDTVVLAGGSAAVPFVAGTISNRVPCRVVVAPRPELTAARGASVVARRGTGTPRTPPPSERHTTVIERQPAVVVDFPRPRPGDSPGERPPPPPIELEPLELPDRRLATRVTSAIRPGVLSALVVAVIAAGVVLTFVLHNGSAANQPPPGRLRGNPAGTTTSSAPHQPGTTGSNGGGR